MQMMPNLRAAARPVPTQLTRSERMMRRTAVLMMAALLATAGCQTLGRAVFSEPVVDFRDLRVRGLGVTGGTIDVELSIYNPNNFALDAKRFTYRLMKIGRASCRERW